MKKQNIDATLINPRFISGLDEKLLAELMENHEVVVTLEDGVLNGGFGEKVARFYGATSMKVLNYGAKKEFTDRIPLQKLYEQNRLIPDMIVDDILALSALK